MDGNICSRAIVQVQFHGNGPFSGKIKDARKRENKCYLDQYSCIAERVNPVHNWWA